MATGLSIGLSEHRRPPPSPGYRLAIDSKVAWRRLAESLSQRQRLYLLGLVSLKFWAGEQLCSLRATVTWTCYIVTVIPARPGQPSQGQSHPRSYPGLSLRQRALRRGSPRLLAGGLPVAPAPVSEAQATDWDVARVSILLMSIRSYMQKYALPPEVCLLCILCI